MMWLPISGMLLMPEPAVNNMNVDNPEQPFEIGVHPKTFVSVGGTTGIGVSDNKGVFAGLNATVSRVNGNSLIGATGDVTWDASSNQLVATVGPRVGKLMFALDGGLAIRSDFTESALGGQVRGSLNLGLGSVYIRTMLWPQTDGGVSAVTQLGFSVNFPQQLGYKPRTTYE